jgi:HD-like signal output (HDOD) protein/CheY-like chemotaxis protein
MQRVLFVDDEPMILHGLRRTLRGMPEGWKMDFTDSGAAALELLRQGPFDVVVSDMRMPGMNGVQLLTEIKRLYPDIIRMVLSGHAETNVVMQAFGVTQQYLTKPCDQQMLRETLDRALTLKRRLNSDGVKQAVGSLESLPSLPAVYQELVACLKSPDASLTEVAHIISGDVGMTIGILKVVNSAYFSLPKPLATIERAVAFLGLKTIMALALEHGLFGGGQAMPAIPGFSLDQLRRHSLATATVARVLARQETVTAPFSDEAFIAGVLHAMGQLVLASSMPERYDKVAELARSEGLAWHEAEQELLQTTHAEAGAYLLGLWGFPNPLVEAVLFHTAPSQAPTPGWALPGVIHVASALAAHPGVADPDDPVLGLEPGYLQGLGLKDRWPDWREACRNVLAGSPEP